MTLRLGESLPQSLLAAHLLGQAHKLPGKHNVLLEGSRRASRLLRGQER